MILRWKFQHVLGNYKDFEIKMKYNLLILILIFYWPIFKYEHEDTNLNIFIFLIFFSEIVQITTGNIILYRKIFDGKIAEMK